MQCSLMMLSKIMLLKWEYQISRGLANGCSADAECRAAMQAAESDEEDADVSELVVPMTLRDARAAGQALKIFVQENQSMEAMRQYLGPIQALSREMEAMTVSARTQQTTMHRFFQPVRTADGVSPSAGAKAD